MSRCVAAAVVCAAVLYAGGCGPGSPPVQPPEPPVVTVEHPVERELDSYTEFTGYLKAVEAVDVRAQVTGFLEDRVLRDAGGRSANSGLVKEGEKLYEIDPEPYDAALKNAEASLARADADVVNAESTSRRAKADLDRVEKAKAALSPEEFDKYRTAAETSAAAVTSAKAAVDVARANLRGRSV